jgi:hypothetical protein
MIGNMMNTTALGFLREQAQDSAISHILSQAGNSKVINNKTKSKYKFNVTSNCWLCEGWVQTKTEVDLKQLIPSFDKDLCPKDKIFIHFSFDNFEPDTLELNENTLKYESLRMVYTIIHYASFI